MCVILFFPMKLTTVKHTFYAPKTYKKFVAEGHYIKGIAQPDKF